MDQSDLESIEKTNYSHFSRALPAQRGPPNAAIKPFQCFGQLQGLVDHDIAANGSFPAGYVGSEHRLYEQTARFEAKFNRVLVYRSQVLHSGLIGAQTILDPNPRVGRLTTNTFVQFDA
jgi:hypothetical protein